MKKRFTSIIALVLLLLSGSLFAASGGPDAYGYVWRDSNDPLGPVPNWIDTTFFPLHLTRVTGLADDNSVGPFNINWNFHYYWGDYNTFRIGSNGWISFDNVSNIASCFPGIPTSGGAGDNFVAPLMSDLNFISSFPAFPNPAKAYYWTNLKDSLVVSFYNTPWWQTGTPDWYGSNTFQVLLDGTDSSITFTYKTMNGVFTPNAGCNTDVVVGIENSTGAIGLECWREVNLASNYAIKFKYPPVALIAVRDLTPIWNQNAANAGEFYPVGLIPNLQSRVKNVGNTAFTTTSTFAGSLRNLSNTSVYSSSRTLPTLAAGQDSLLIYSPQAVVNTAGQYSWQVTCNNTADINPGNNTNASEIELVNLSGPTAQLTYTTGGGSTYAWGWNGGGSDDGVGVYMYPPVHPMSINSTQVFIASASFSGYIISIFADNGPNGAPGTLLRTDTIPFNQVVVGNWNTVNYTVPVSIGSGGFYVAWMMGGSDMFLGTEDVGPISRRTYEVLGGAWSSFRDNNLREAMIRVNIGGYPCAISSGFTYSSNLNTISFSNQSTGGTSYLWDFGDGGTSTSLSPSHTYAAFGTYTVCLISTNSCGSDTTCIAVPVTCPTPSAAFTSVRNGFNVAFTDGSASSPSSWSWSFGDGGTSTLQNPSHTYAAPGTYNVCLVTTNICGADTICNNVTVCAQPLSSFTSTSTGLSATFTNSSTNGTTSFWNFGDGVNSTQTNPVHVYTSPGTYIVCLITYNACYTDTLCQSVTICPLPASAFSFSAAQFVYNFSDNTTGPNTAWAWTFGDGGSSSSQNPSHTYAANGTYLVCLTVTNSCGNDSSCQSLVVNVVGVADGLNDGGLQLWPNPARNMLKVSLLLPSSMPLQLKVRDMAGRCVHLSDVTMASGTWTSQLDIASLAAGMYMLEVQGDGLHAMRKFVKE
jgi:PKD repeat protein